MANQATTKEEVLSRLEALTYDDPEGAHYEADRLLMDALLLVGMNDVVTAYLEAKDRAGFWYA